MHGEAAVLVDVVTVGGTGAVVGVVGVADGVDEGAAGPQHPAAFVIAAVAMKGQ